MCKLLLINERNNLYFVHKKFTCNYGRPEVEWDRKKVTDSYMEAEMRKKSHISLARYIVDSFDDADLKKHRFSFYLGSILPDIKPSFLYKRHEINGTFPMLQKHIKRLSEGQKAIEKKKTIKYYRDLGQISHYLADYFTFPHNTIYLGSLKAHCSYEEQLKQDLRACIKSGEAAKYLAEQCAKHFRNAEALCSFIQKTHDEYIERKHDVEDDIHHILEINQRAIEGILQLLAKNRAEHLPQHA